MAELEGMNQDYETIPGSEPGSFYLVIAKAGGLKLAIRPLTFIKDKEMYLGARLRVVSDNMDGDVSTAATVFAFPEGFAVKQTHASMVCGISVLKMPFVPQQFHQVVEENQLVDVFVEALITRLQQAWGITEGEKVTKQVIIEWLKNGYDSQIPQPGLKESDHKIVFGLQ